MSIAESGYKTSGHSEYGLLFADSDIRKEKSYWKGVDTVFRDILHSVQSVQTHEAILDERQLQQRVEALLLIPSVYNAIPDQFASYGGQYIRGNMNMDQWLHLCSVQHLTRWDETHRAYAHIKVLAEHFFDPRIQTYKDFWPVLVRKLQELRITPKQLDITIKNNIVLEEPNTSYGDTSLEYERMPNGEYCRRLWFSGKATDPIAHVRRLQREIREIRIGKREYVAHEYARNTTPIRLTSWLNATPQHFFFMTGLDTEYLIDSGGIYIPQISVEQLLQDSYVYRIDDYIASPEMLRIAVHNTLLSPAYIRKFLATGTLPDLGFSLIPGQLFFEY